MLKLDYTDQILYLSEFAKAVRQRERERITLAYMQAMWGRIEPAHIPPLKDLIGEDEIEIKEQQSPDEMADILQTFARRSKKRR